VLSNAIDGYLRVRRAAGFQLRGEELMLHSFARFARERGETHLRASSAVEWAARAASPERRERCLRVLGRFAAHARAEDSAHEQPPRAVFSAQEVSPRRRPYVFSPREVRDLLQAASALSPSGSLRPHTYYALLGLLAATGLRIGEALRLRLDDVTADGLLVSNTKFRKSRLVPLHPTTAAALQRYVTRRRRVGGTTYLFVSDAGSPLSYNGVRKVFHGLVRRVGVNPAHGQRSPTPHCLRHTFAVRALECAPHPRQSVTPYLLALSTYLGHGSAEATYRYLHLTPHLVQSVCDACEGLVEGGAP
jgi:integrase